MWTLISLLIIAAVVLLDQVSKILVVAFLYRDSVPLLKDVLHFTYVENRGMAFGLLQDRRWVFLVFSTLGIAMMGVYLFRYAVKPFTRIGLALIVGGGIGNMLDRIFRGFVVDFIDFCAFDFWVWVFNIADAAVCVGAVFFVLGLVLEIKEEAKGKGEKHG